MTIKKETRSNLTIPRRGLLAGTALVLLGASACGNSKKPLRTKFMKDFTSAFIGDWTKIKDPAPPPATDLWPDPNRLWPKPGQTKTDVVADYATFVNVLLTVGLVGGPPPTFPNNSLGYQIVQFLNTYPWPTPTGVPSQYLGELPTVYLVEIAVIQDRLLQAINSFDFTGHGAGGAGSNWPPH